MPYSFITFAQAKTALAQRLYDATKVFFSDTELGRYVTEAMQCFNALAQTQRDTFTFATEPDTTWYDLTSVTQMPLTTRPMTTTDLDLLQLIQYHLLEPVNTTYPLIWAGSTQFALSDVLNAIQQYRDMLLGDTGCTVTQELQAASTISVRTTLSDSALEIRRVAWIPDTPDLGNGYLTNCLMSSDIWAQQSFEPGFLQESFGVPLSYRVSSEPPLTFDVDFLPPITGQYDILRINAGSALSTSASSVLPIPNDWAWVNKFGAMSELLNRGSLATDAYRAQYCWMRYKQGVAAMNLAPALLAARIDPCDTIVFQGIPVVYSSDTLKYCPGRGAGVVASIDAVRDGDFYNANWQANETGAPTDVYYAGLNLLALSPIPDDFYTVTVSVVRNMPLPEIDGDYLQIGRDDVDAVLDYAEHLAMFKIGGFEFAQTVGLYKDFFRHCTLRNSRLAAVSDYLEMLDNRAQQEQRVNPYFKSPTPQEVGD